MKKQLLFLALGVIGLVGVAQTAAAESDRANTTLYVDESTICKGKSTPCLLTYKDWLQLPSAQQSLALMNAVRSKTVRELMPLQEKANFLFFVADAGYSTAAGNFLTLRATNYTSLLLAELNAVKAAHLLLAFRDGFYGTVSNTADAHIAFVPSEVVDVITGFQPAFRQEVFTELDKLNAPFATSLRKRLPVQITAKDPPF